MNVPASNARLGIFVDGAHLSLYGGHGMRYDVLREFATRDGAEPARMNVYVPYDVERATQDGGYRRGQVNFCSVLRDFGYKVVQQPVRWGLDDRGNRCARSCVPLALAVDLLQQAENLERILLVTGDDHFIPVVRALQARGLRVEVVGFDGLAQALREESDGCFSGYMIPNLLPIPDQPDRSAWGELGHRARGVCYSHSGKGYGFLRYIQHISPSMWITDSRHPDSPFETVFFHDSQLPRTVSYHQLPSRDIIFEFELAKSDRFEDDLQAINLRTVSGIAMAGGPRGRDVAAAEAPGRREEEVLADSWEETDSDAWEDEALEEEYVDEDETLEEGAGEEERR